MSDKIVEVAVGVLMGPDGRVFMASRPAGKVYAGYWEFPGGKVEAGESAHDALVRELREELGIEVRTAYPWLTQVFTYPHATVRLRFFQVVDWSGSPHPHEGQQFAWQDPLAPSVAPILPANGPIMRALALPRVMGISDVGERGTEAFLTDMACQLEQGLQLIQLREHAMSDEQFQAFAQDALDLARPYGASVVLNRSVALARSMDVAGVHLGARALMSLEARPDFQWVGASCHDAEELAKAAALGLDYALLSPVKRSASHPESPGLGWDRFAAILSGGYFLPVFALGGLTPDDLTAARQYGAHGIAMQRAVWKPQA